MKETVKSLFSISFTKQLIISWFVLTSLLLMMFYLFAPALGHILVIPVQKFNWVEFLSANAFWADVYRDFIWICYFIPLLYVFNVTFTFITYLCINNEYIHDENTFAYIKIALVNSLKVMVVQLPAMGLICLILSLFGRAKTILILTPFSTEIIRVAVFSIWLISLVIIQIAFALKMELKSSLKYAWRLIKEYKLIWWVFTLALITVSLVLAKGLVRLLPNFAGNGFFSNLSLTGFALAVYIIVIVFLLHHLFTSEKPFELENEE